MGTMKGSPEWVGLFFADARSKNNESDIHHTLKALTTESSLLANMVPMWTLQSIGAMLVETPQSSFVDVLANSEFYEEYQTLVTGPLVAQLFASTNEASFELSTPEVARADASGNHIHMYQRNNQGPPTGTTYTALARMQAELLLPVSNSKRRGKCTFTRAQNKLRSSQVSLNSALEASVHAHCA